MRGGDGYCIQIWTSIYRHTICKPNTQQGLEITRCARESIYDVLLRAHRCRSSLFTAGITICFAGMSWSRHVSLQFAMNQYICQDLFCMLTLVLLRIPAASNPTYAGCSCLCKILLTSGKHFEYVNTSGTLSDLSFFSLYLGTCSLGIASTLRSWPSVCFPE